MKLLPAILAVGLAAPLAAQQGSAPVSPSTIEVSAMGRYEAPPDTVTLEFEVSSQDKAAAKAYAQAQTETEALRTLLQQQGIAAAQAHLGSYDTVPFYDWRSSRITAYTVSARLSLELTDFSKLGPLVDAAGASGSAALRGVTFGLKNMDAAKQKAIADGYLEAHQEAEALAAAANVQIVGLENATVDVTLPVGRTAPRAMLAAAPNAGAAAPAPTQDFTPTPIAVTARIEARYRIAP